MGRDRNVVLSACWMLLLNVVVSSLPRVGGMRVQIEADHLSYFWTPLLRGIGLTNNATININLTTQVPSPNAFILLFNEAQFVSSLRYLLLQSMHVPSTYLPCEWRASLAESVDAEHRITSRESGRYWLGILQGRAKAVHGLSGEIGFLNDGSDELSLPHNDASRVFLFVAWLFFGSAVVFLILMALCRKGVSRLHVLIFATLIFKSFVLLLMRQDLVIISKTGKRSLSQQVICEVLRQIHSILEVVVFYVIGLGWKIMRPHLRASEWAFASTIATLSFFLGSFKVACSTFAACTGKSYLLTQFTLHSLCFLVVIVATNFNIFTLQRQISDALATPETGKLYTKHRSYCWFRGFFLFFVIIPSITNFLTLHVLSWDEQWVVVLMSEFSFWLVHSAVCLLFRPGKHKLLVFELAVVESSDSDSAGQEGDINESPPLQYNH